MEQILYNPAQYHIATQRYDILWIYFLGFLNQERMKAYINKEEKGGI